MRAAIIENGFVSNVIEVEDLTVFPNLVDASVGCNPGDKYANGVFTPSIAVLTPSQINAPILSQLDFLDAKSIRALREGDAVRIASIESEAAALRLQLVKTS